MPTHYSARTTAGRLPNDEERNRAAILWSLVAVGLLLHNVLHIFSYIAELARVTRDMAPFELEIYDVGVLWAYAITLAPVILPALLSICGKGKASAWVALLLGTALVFMHALAGWYHGIYDGASYLAFSATVAILLPAFFATRSSWRLIRSA